MSLKNKKAYRCLFINFDSPIISVHLSHAWHTQDLLSIAPKAKKAVAEHFFAAGFLLLQGVDRSDEDTVETICRLSCYHQL
jgi:hypothetical protein